MGSRHDPVGRMRIVVSTVGHLLAGAAREVHDLGLDWAFEEWFADTAEAKWRYYIANDNEALSHEYLMQRSRLLKKKSRSGIAEKAKKNTKKKPARGGKFKLVLPTTRSIPVQDPWRYAYHVCGERKIGKTSLAIEGSEEIVFQMDKPQLGFSVREIMVRCWSDRMGKTAGFIQGIDALEALYAERGPYKADGTGFPYNRIVVDGVAELYAMVTKWACKTHGITHPSENENWGATWTLIRETFLEAVNRLMHLQGVAECGLFFISHTEWRERKVKGGSSIMKLESDLPSRCEKIINGKVDAWLVYDYVGDNRVLYTLGSQEIGAGHRIDGHFRTPSGERIIEIYMGNADTDAAFSLSQFLKAFNNEYPFRTMKEFKQSGKTKKSKKRKRS